MNIGRIDVFENETEIKDMVCKLQRKGLEYMLVPDDLWHSKSNKRALNSIREMEKKVLAAL